MVTCTATLTPDHPAVMLWWAQAVHSEDVQTAFRELNSLLDTAESPLYVFVDLRERPNFPLADTLRGALEGPFRHPMLKEWLVIGSNPMAHTIGRILTSITRRNNIKWFNTEEKAIEYLLISSGQPS